MAQKFANRGNVSQIITAHRKRQLRPATYIYILIGTSIISTAFTTLIVTGKIDTGFITRNTMVSSAPIKNTIDFLNEDFAGKRISADEYALFIKDYLIRYDSLPARYKAERITLTSEQVYHTLHDIWPQVSLRTRSRLLVTMPYLETQWKNIGIDLKQRN